MVWLERGANVPLHSIPDDSTVHEWDDMREAESGIDNYYAFGSAQKLMSPE
jgi:hypothetical protein